VPVGQELGPPVGGLAPRGVVRRERLELSSSRRHRVDAGACPAGREQEGAVRAPGAAEGPGLREGAEPLHGPARQVELADLPLREEGEGVAIGGPEWRGRSFRSRQGTDGRRIERPGTEHGLTVRARSGEHDLATVRGDDRCSLRRRQALGRVEHEMRGAPRLGGLGELPVGQERGEPGGDQERGHPGALAQAAPALGPAHILELCRRSLAFNRGSGPHLLDLQPRVTDVLEPLPRTFAQTPSEQLRDRRGALGRQAVPGRLFLDDRRHHVGGRLSREERLPGEHLEEHDTEAPDVGLLVDALAARLLGGHVGGGPEDDPGQRPGPGEGGGLGEVDRGRAGAGVARPGLGEAEVEDLDLSAGRELDVGGREVAVDDALAVGLLEGRGDLLGDLEGLVDGDRTPREALLEVFTHDELEGEEGLSVRFFQTVDGGDVRVVERGEEVRLALETGEALGVLSDLGREDLDGHVTVKVGVGGAVDLAHAPGPDGGGDAVVGKGLADQDDPPGGTPCVSCGSVFWQEAPGIIHRPAPQLGAPRVESIVFDSVRAEFPGPTPSFTSGENRALPGRRSGRVSRETASRSDEAGSRRTSRRPECRTGVE
jgi:hypothetical protein